MALWEPNWNYTQRQQRDSERYPELQFADPDEIGRIDSANAREGLPLTTLAETTLFNVLRAGVPQEEQRQIESFRSDPDEELFAPRVAAQPRTESPFAIQAFREQAGLNDEPEDDGGGGFGGFLRRAVDVPTQVPGSPLGNLRTGFDIGSSLVGGGVDLLQGDLPDFPNPLDIAEGAVVEGVNDARNLNPVTPALDLFRDREQAETLSDVPGTLLGGFQDIDTATGLPFRTPIRQGSQALTDPIGALRDQFEQEQQGGIGFGFEGSAPFEQLRRVPGIERDIPGTEISPFDITLAVADMTLDVGSLAGVAKLPKLGTRNVVTRSAFDSLLPEISGQPIRLAGASAPHSVAIPQARTIAQSDVARDFIERAAANGNDSVPSEIIEALDHADLIRIQDE